jgi:hypothetical protein
METIQQIIEIAFSGLWQFVGMSILLNGLAYFTVNGIIRLSTRFFRLVMVSFRGWPPNHLDADGDWKGSNN